MLYYRSIGEMGLLSHSRLRYMSDFEYSRVILYPTRWRSFKVLKSNSKFKFENVFCENLDIRIRWIKIQIQDIFHDTDLVSFNEIQLESSTLMESFLNANCVIWRSLEVTNSKSILQERGTIGIRLKITEISTFRFVTACLKKN